MKEMNQEVKKEKEQEEKKLTIQSEPAICLRVQVARMV